MTDSTETLKSEPRPRPKSTRKLDSIIGYFAQVVSCCLIMMWSVMNIAHNFKVMREINNMAAEPMKHVQNNDLSPDWNILIGMTIVFGVIPFLISLYWLYRIFNKPSRA